MSSAAEFLKTEARLRAIASRFAAVWRIQEDLHANKRTISDLTDEELLLMVEYGSDRDGVDYTTLSDQELERLIADNRREED